MKFCDPHARSVPTVLDRPRNLPADVVHSREIEWLGELRSRLAAVEAWRGTTAVHHRPEPVARPACRA
jgi:hypothetical protein